MADVQPLTAMERIAAAEVRAFAAEMRVELLERRFAEVCTNQVEVMRALANMSAAVVALQDLVCSDVGDDGLPDAPPIDRTFGKVN